MSAEDHPQRPRIPASARWQQGRPVRPTCCGWCSAHTAALRDRSSRRARILQSCSTERRSRSQSGARRSRRSEPRLPPQASNCPAWGTLLRPEGRAPNSSRHAKIFPLRWPSWEHRGIVGGAWLFVPEGRRRKLAGGKLASAGAAPGCPARRAMPRRGIEEVSGVAHAAAFPPPLVAAEQSDRQRATSLPGCFFDAPLGQGGTRHGFRGRRPLARTCPRLISSGVPPGRETGGHALTQGNRREQGFPNSFGCGLTVTMQQERGLQAAAAWILYGANEFPAAFFDSPNGEWRDAFGWFGTVAAGERFCGLKAALLSPSMRRYGFTALCYNSAKSSCAARILHGARLCARSTSRSRLAASVAADFNRCRRGFGAAAAGPRRTQPRSFGCGFAALCSSCLCGSSPSARMESCG